LDSSSELAFGPVFDTVDIGLVLLDRCTIAGGTLDGAPEQPIEEVLGKPSLTSFRLRGRRLPNVIEDPSVQEVRAS
jgi:hypothetical protein